MFETMQSFLAFFFPTLALIILGILFEEKLIAFEQKLFGKRASGKKQAAVSGSRPRAQHRPALRRVQGNRPSHRSQRNRAA